ncbi:amidohydrolase family protein [Gracilimonas sediminicola]|uniref:Amidohydrolase family protein n=1 Tax=Gracilimonas sediminicola TaxID=2952158 RepID=A0A9X2L2J6_9BACT|nr:amidohydrolase family protein [Gracilimonas sediminicola]MCP9291151.1 amidohydrolase family protein [Gracilimonas sediminicola]
MRLFRKLLLIPALLLVFSFNTAEAQIAVKGETVYTMAGDPIPNGVVLIKDGKIERVGSASSVNIPSSYEVHEAKVVTPGLIDAHSVVGLAGHLNQDHDQDQLETSSAIQPELRAIDAYNAREALVGHLRELGITTVHTGHGPGALISGQTMIVKTVGETVEESTIVPAKMLAFTLGNNMSREISKPGTRSKGIAMLRQEFIKAKDYLEKRNGDEDYSMDLGLEALADLLEGKLTALVTVHKANDIMTAVRLQEEFGFPMVLDGAAEAYLIIDELKEAGHPVIVHPTMIRTYGDSKNATFETAAKLYEAGIPIAFQSGYEGYVPKTRVVLFEAGVAAANGLGMENALKVLTIDAAELLGIDNRVGSLEAGKDADVVMFDGDPLEYITNVTGVIIDGVKVK